MGDKVFIKLQPYVQSSVAKRACHKLSFKYYGPFEIRERIGQVAYRVALPETSAIHPVFHVSLLRKALKPHDQVSPILPTDANKFVLPDRILELRSKNKANRVVEQGLVHWSGTALPDSWEDLEDLRTRFPFAPAWGQAEPEEEGGVNTATQDGPHSHCRPSLPEEAARLRSRRHRKPNTRVTGSSWVN